MRRHRRLHRRERQHRNKVIVMSLFGLVLLLSCGYAAFSTQLSLSAKGTIKKVVKYTIDDLKTLATTSGDGLYKDDYGYIYKGNNPDNYITFNNETWRIISIESDNTIKIVRNESIGDYSFDDSSDSCPSSVTYNSIRKNKDGYYKVDNIIYTAPDINDLAGGCNQWQYANLQSYLNGTYYNSLADTSNIVSHSWNVGAVTEDSSYAQTLATDISQEQATTWTGNVGLINVSDYARTNTNTGLCGTVNKNSSGAGSYTTCKETTWLFNSSSYWTINPFSSSSTHVYDISSVGYIGSYYSYWYNSMEDLEMSASEVYPAVHLNSNIKLSGSGTEQDAYKITN